jgi:hypothetical protein
LVAGIVVSDDGPGRLLFGDVRLKGVHIFVDADGDD